MAKFIVQALFLHGSFVNHFCNRLDFRSTVVMAFHKVGNVTVKCQIANFGLVERTPLVSGTML